jgi:phage terminase small subunit
MGKRVRQKKSPTPKQRRFAELYHELGNATEAYRRVYGVSRRVAENTGPRLLGNARVRAIVRELQEDLSRASKTTVEWMDRELECAAAFDPADILDPETGATLPVHRWPAHARRALAGFEEEALFEMVPTGETGPRGGVVKERVQVGVVRKFKWHNKTEAKKLWYQRRGALVEKLEHTVPAGQSEPTDEELEALSLLLHKVRGESKGDAR